MNTWYATRSALRRWTRAGIVAALVALVSGAAAWAAVAVAPGEPAPTPSTVRQSARIPGPLPSGLVEMDGRGVRVSLPPGPGGGPRIEASAGSGGASARVEIGGCPHSR
ncbi:hypothetical protein QMK28_32900, partial [Streptomyces sp. H27-D2]|nr:hypothetical protein [Streptomyces sp. H27-D2]